MEADVFPRFLRAKAFGNLTPISALVRLSLGLLALWAGLATGFSFIFLDQDRQKRLWVSTLYLDGTASGSALTMVPDLVRTGDPPIHHRDPADRLTPIRAGPDPRATRPERDNALPHHPYPRAIRPQVTTATRSRRRASGRAHHGCIDGTICLCAWSPPLSGLCGLCSWSNSERMDWICALDYSVSWFFRRTGSAPCLSVFSSNSPSFLSLVSPLVKLASFLSFTPSSQRSRVPLVRWCAPRSFDSSRSNSEACIFHSLSPSRLRLVVCVLGH